MGGSSASLTAYLKDDRELTTKQVVDKWKKEMRDIPDCNITVESSSMMSSFSSSNDLQVILQSSQLDDLKEASDSLVDELTQYPGLIKVHSDLENAAPVIKVHVDPIEAAADGVAPASVGGLLNNMLSGVKAMTMDVDGNNVDVKVEYPDGEYDTLDKVKGITIPTQTGGSVALTDIADIVYEDSPAGITSLKSIIFRQSGIF